MANTRVNVYIDGFNLYHSVLQHTHTDFCKKPSAMSENYKSLTCFSVKPEYLVI